MEEAEDEKFYKTDAKTATAGSLLIYKSFFLISLETSVHISHYPHIIA